MAASQRRVIVAVDPQGVPSYTIQPEVAYDNLIVTPAVV